MVDLSTYHANANPPLAAASQPRAGGAADWETIAAELNGAAAQPLPAAGITEASVPASQTEAAAGVAARAAQAAPAIASFLSHLPH